MTFKWWSSLKEVSSWQKEYVSEVPSDFVRAAVAARDKYKKQAKRLRRELHVYRETFGNVHDSPWGMVADDMAEAMKKTGEDK